MDFGKILDFLSDVLLQVTDMLEREIMLVENFIISKWGRNCTAAWVEIQYL